MYASSFSFNPLEFALIRTPNIRSLLDFDMITMDLSLHPNSDLLRF